MKLLTLALVFLSLTSCGKKQSPANTSEEGAAVGIVDSTNTNPAKSIGLDYAELLSTDTTIVTVGYADDGAVLHPLTMSKVKAEAFAAIDTSNTKLVVRQVRQTDSLFYLSIAGEERAFKKETNFSYGDRNGESWFEYVGSYSDWGLDALFGYSVSESFGFSDFILIDSATGQVYRLLPIGDGFEATPIVSPDSKYMLYYYNDIYSGDDTSKICLLKFDSRNDPKAYITRYAVADSLNFFIEAVAWLNDSSFMVKAYTEKQVGEGASQRVVKNYSYYRFDL